MSLSNYPPGVTGNEPEIAGYDEIPWTCSECDTEGTAYGSRVSDHFTFECEQCGSDEEIIGALASEEAERAMDAARDERLERG